jgi:hypothetical protein
VKENKKVRKERRMNRGEERIWTKEYEGNGDRDKIRTLGNHNKEAEKTEEKVKDKYVENLMKKE